MITDAFFLQETAKWERLFYRVCRSMLQDEADCCDAVQEALLKAWKCKERIDKERFRAYFIRILINECHNIGRQKKRMTPVEWMPEQPAEPTEHVEIMDALMGLKEKDRLILVMHYMEGFRLQEIARAMQMPLGTVKYRISNARKAFQAQWFAEEKKGGAQE